MISLISDNKDAIARICRQYGIQELEVFGSASTGAFDEKTSDIDFIADHRTFLIGSDPLES